MCALHAGVLRPPLRPAPALCALLCAQVADPCHHPPGPSALWLQVGLGQWEELAGDGNMEKRDAAGFCVPALLWF